MLHQLLCLLLGLSFVLSQTLSPAEIEQRIKQLYGNEASTEPKNCTGGVCSPYEKCDMGFDEIDPRIGEDDECHYLHVCCPHDNIIQIEGTSEKPNYNRKGCGDRNVNGVGFRITEPDNEAQYGEFPWMVAVLKNEMNTYQCGGALIHPQVVVTVAHCVSGKTPDQLKIRAGEWDTQTTNEVWPHQDRNVSEIVIHEQFHKRALHNDIALLFLNEGVTLAANIDTLCLPPPNFVFDSSDCIASGWGKDVYGKDGQFQVILKKIELPIVRNQHCQDALRATRLGRRFRLHDSFICAGGELGKDTCRGDGGSPLVCPIPGMVNRYYHAGIVSWGIGCGQDNIPGVYVNVAQFRDWIDGQINRKGHDGSYYTHN